MTEHQLEILWEGEIQGCMLDKKKHWKQRTKLMRGALIQTGVEDLKLEMSSDLRRLTDKKIVPVNEDIDLSSVVFVGDQTGAKEFNFFCQCLRLNEEGEEEIVVHLFQTENDDLRKSFWEAILEFMRKKVTTIPTYFFQVSVQKVDLDKGMKLLGNYILRSSPSEIEFMLAENIPGVKFEQEEIASIKLLEDMRLDKGEHVIDLILRGSEASRKQHIVITSKWAYLLLAYLKRGDMKLGEDPQEIRCIASLPLSPIHTRNPAIPPKPFGEDGPPLPPRVTTVTEKGATLGNRRVRGSIGDGDTRINPPLPPRNEKERFPSLPPRNENIGRKGFTLPRNMKLPRMFQLEDKLSSVQNPRKKFDIPITPIEEVVESLVPASSVKKRLTLRERQPMPTPENSPPVTPVSKQNESPQYAEIEFETVTSPRNRPQKMNLKTDSVHGYAVINWNSQSVETPITDLVDETRFEFPEKVAVEKDEGGYLKLETYEGKVDAGGYLTISEISLPLEEGKSKKVCSSSTSDSPIVPPRTYREFINN